MMFLLFIFLSILSFTSSSHSSYYTTSQNGIRLMTFNIWQSGANVENGQQKIAKHILMVNPDVVALQVS